VNVYSCFQKRTQTDNKSLCQTSTITSTLLPPHAGSIRAVDRAAYRKGDFSISQPRYKMGESHLLNSPHLHRDLHPATLKIFAKCCCSISSLSSWSLSASLSPLPASSSLPRPPTKSADYLRQATRSPLPFSPLPSSLSPGLSSRRTTTPLAPYLRPHCRWRTTTTSSTRSHSARFAR